MALMVQIADPEQLVVTCHVGGAYSPDVLDDIKRRVLDLYQQTLSYRHVVGAMYPQIVQEEL